MTQLVQLEPEQARACGIGEGANCCAYLLLDADGFQCAQRSKLAAQLFARAKAGLMNAQRTPFGDFPHCQREGRP